MKEKRVCVTGAGGFLASWLVKLLLSQGYKVHGTVRVPSDSGKNGHLTRLEKAAENLQLFKADLQDYSAIAAAISGCEGVFHVASPVILSGVSDPEAELIRPAVVGTANVLKASLEASVKRVVVVSSISAVARNSDWPKGTWMDESSWSHEDLCRASQSWYCLSKTIAEKEAFKYARENGLDVVTLCPSFILGPILQSTMNETSSFIINILKGTMEFVDKLRPTHFVDVRDVADALLLVYESRNASGRYICTLEPIKIVDLINMLKSVCPAFNLPNSVPDLETGAYIGSEKLKQIGWKAKRTVKESLSDSIRSYKEAGLLSPE